MFTMSTLTEFLGWSSVINIGILVLATLLVSSMRESMAKFHGKIFGVAAADVSRVYFQYIAQYKITIFVLNLVPYIALKIMS